MLLTKPLKLRVRATCLSLKANQTLNHPQMPIIVSHPRHNDGSDTAIMPVLTVETLIDGEEIFISERGYSLLSGCEGATYIVEEGFFHRQPKSHGTRLIHLHTRLGIPQTLRNQIPSGRESLNFPNLASGSVE